MNDHVETLRKILHLRKTREEIAEFNRHKARHANLRAQASLSAAEDTLDLTQKTTDREMRLELRSKVKSGEAAARFQAIAMRLNILRSDEKYYEARVANANRAVSESELDFEEKRKDHSVRLAQLSPIEDLLEQEILQHRKTQEHKDEDNMDLDAILFKGAPHA